MLQFQHLGENIMIDARTIQSDITEIERLYNDTQTELRHAVYYSKLALMEICGWLEEAMDIIIKDYSVAKLVNSKEVEKNITSQTYGFDYDQHFRKMLMKLIGLRNLASIEKNLEKDILILKSKLGSLWKRRKQAAHSSIGGVTLTLDAPARINADLTIVVEILKKMESEINKY